MSHLRRITIVVLVACFGGLSAVALVACGDDDILGDDGTEEVDITLSERDLKPGRVEVDAGEIEFVARNDGDRLHAFAVETPDGVERTENIEPGETKRVSVDLSAGRYRMYDPRGGYRTRGVRGTVVVRSRDTDTVTERTVERTVVEEPDVDVDVPEVDDPEVQEPEVQEPQAPPPAPVQPPPPARTVTKEVPVQPPPVEEPASP